MRSSHTPSRFGARPCWVLLTKILGLYLSARLLSITSQTATLMLFGLGSGRVDSGDKFGRAMTRTLYAQDRPVMRHNPAIRNLARNELRGDYSPRTGLLDTIARTGEHKANMLRSCTWFFERARLRSETFETFSTQ
jgi:hypothetical protein